MYVRIYFCRNVSFFKKRFYVYMYETLYVCMCLYVTIRAYVSNFECLDLSLYVHMFLCMFILMNAYK